MGADIRRLPLRNDGERRIAEAADALNRRPAADDRPMVVPQRRLAAAPPPRLLQQPPPVARDARNNAAPAALPLMPRPAIAQRAQPAPNRPRIEHAPVVPPAPVGYPPVDWLPRRRVPLPRLARLAPKPPRLPCLIAPETMTAHQIAVRTSCNRVMLLNLELAQQEFGLFRRLIAFAPISAREVYHVPLERKQLMMCLAWTKRHMPDSSAKVELDDSGMLEDPCAHDNFDRANENLYVCRLVDLCSFIHIAHTMDSDKMMAEAMRAFEFRYAKREPWKTERRRPAAESCRRHDAPV